jgi:hypothetical protein
MSAIAHTFIDIAVLDLDALRHMTYAELGALYRSARCPSSVLELNGDTRGAMLAWRHPRTGPIAWWLRTFGASSAFPWEGKSFPGRNKCFAPNRRFARNGCFVRGWCLVRERRFASGSRPRHQPSQLVRQTTLVPVQDSYRHFLSRWQTSF